MIWAAENYAYWCFIQKARLCLYKYSISTFFSNSSLQLLYRLNQKLSCNWQICSMWILECNVEVYSQEILWCSPVLAYDWSTFWLLLTGSSLDHLSSHHWPKVYIGKGYKRGCCLLPALSTVQTLLYCLFTPMKMVTIGIAEMLGRGF